MKKLIAFILSLTMIFTLFGVNAFAATDDSQITIEEALAKGVLLVSLESASVEACSEVELDLVLESNPGFSVMVLDLDHSGSNIVLKSAVSAASGVTVEFSDNGGKSTVAFYHLGSDYAQSGKLATLTFSVGAFFGEAEIEISAEKGNVCDANADVIEPEFINGTISVSCTHTYVFKDRVEPSCSKTGAINYECTICGAISTTVINKSAHTYSSEKVVVSAPNCETSGKKAYKCEFCGELKDVEEIAPLGHKYVDENAYIVTVEATCTSVGSKYRDCYVCNTRVVEEIPALGHDDGTWRITYPGDCTAEGVVSRYCNRCDYVLETKVKEQGSHFMGWAVTKAPTCSEEGTEEYMCLICGGEKGESRAVAKLDHVHGEEVVVKAPTCSEKGTSQVICAICDQVVSTKEIDKVDHVKNTLTVITAPTAATEGAGEYKCKVCGESIESVVLPVTNGEIYAQSVSAAVGKDAQIKVFIKNNPGFSVGIIRIKYDETSLIFKEVIAGDITDDITVGVPKAGEIAVLVSLDSAQYTENGYVFAINFTLTQDAADGNVELFYDPQNDFAAENGDRVFFNMKSTEITIIDSLPGDVNGDGNIDTTDLAALKLYLAGASEEVSAGADSDGNGKIDTGDLATLKLMLAGVIV